MPRPFLPRLEASKLRILAYENDNASTGFVAYAFASRGETIVAVRGSETKGACAPTNVDWRDNFCAPLTGSVQYAAATAFADRYQEGSLLLTGHSKGGNVALYAQSAAQNPLARAAVFNAQGFACHALSKTRKQRLRAGAVNYVVAGDIVGALLCHPETRFYVRQNPGTNAHSPDAFAFDAEGFPIPARRTWLSRAVEVLSRLLLALETLGFTNVTRRLLACPRAGITQTAWTALPRRGIMICVPGPPGCILRKRSEMPWSRSTRMYISTRIRSPRKPPRASANSMTSPSTTMAASRR